MQQEFKPFEEKGIEINKQYKSFDSLVIKKPFDKKETDAYTKCRIVLMNGLENASNITLHEMARQTTDYNIKKALSMIRRSEQQQQVAINWLNPADQTVLETTITFEQVAVDLTANVARNEPNLEAKKVYDFGLLEDFDHLLRYSYLLKMLEGGEATILLQGKTELKDGRPTWDEHRHPYDTMMQHYQRTDGIKTKLNALTVTAAEQQTMLYYREHGNAYKDNLARQLYAEIAEIEEQHVTQYECLFDASWTPLERLCLIQVNEAYNYFSCMQTETDDRIRKIWEEFYYMELEHLRIAGDLLKNMEGNDIHSLIPYTISPLIVFEPNKEYINQVIRETVNWRPYDMRFVNRDQLPSDWASFAYEEQVRGSGFPSQIITDRAKREWKMAA
ncbi:MAG: hypothetical protein K6U11_12330 [bacterium]|nr:hypothetical protein [bacterium]